MMWHLERPGAHSQYDDLQTLASTMQGLMFLWSSFLLGLSDGMLVALSHIRSPALYLTASVLRLSYRAFVRSEVSGLRSP